MNTDTSNIKATRIVSGVSCGKTQELIGRACSLLSNGEKAEDVLVLCATPQACEAFTLRLNAAAEEAGANADGVTVTTPRALALNVLGDAEAVRWSGREPRLLTAYEELFLLEDMKVSGLRPKRLREMLKFFYRSWTELADDDPDWLLPGEESNVHTLLKDNLAFTRSIAEPEAGNLAVNYLRTHAGAAAAHSFAHVLVDDYQRISKASQLLASLVAAETLTIAGDRAACVQVYDSYPYAAGLDEFMDAHEGAQDIELSACHACAAGAAATSKLLADPAMQSIAFHAAEDVAAGQTAVLESPLPEDEFGAVARFAAEAVADGKNPADIVVATPNGVWSRNMVKALLAAKVPAQALNDRQPVRGDIRDNERCVPARVLTALDLVADPENALAWRCWCGYGDWLANSSAMANLRKHAGERGMGLVEALRGTQGDAVAANASDADRVVGAKRVADAHEAGLALIESAAGLEGSALLDKLAELVTSQEGAAAPGIVSTLCLGERDNSAAAMAKRFRSRLLAPRIDAASAVQVVPYDQVAGLSPKVLIISGFVNGFIPCREYFDSAEMPLDKQEKEHAKDAHRVYAMAGKASEQLAISRFTTTSLETAGVMKLHIGRIRLQDGKRMCVIEPSDFTEQLA
ncbi:AAA family ATPase [uncultured Senegalimassilia sp.]|mgnify:FL=1|uniref:AAA family ATPase n=1 Tax=uncultured Senegalimassilia sp. TaxID=1714350 RepID=UPI0025F74332|nr:AAA family ATPase [uncultured Senegalimassilia sp.]